MSNFTKTALAVLALSSSVGFAGTMGPECTREAVTVPCETIAWDFGISALYLKPVYSADFGYYNYTNLGSTREYREYKNPWEWGFKLEGSYHWCTGNDLNISWYRLRANTGDHELGPINLEEFTVLGGFFHRESHWDALNGEFAQTANLGRFILRAHGGFQFASIKTEEERLLPGVVGAVESWTEFRKSEFNGFGPRLGVDLTYDCGNGFGVFAKPAIAVLLGTNSFRDEYSRIASFLIASYGSKRAIVPEFETKLGVDWVYGLAQGDLTFDLGYMWFNYLNAQHSITNLTSTAFMNLESDFAASGLFFGVVYKGVV